MQVLAVGAFDTPDPPGFIVDSEQQVGHATYITLQRATPEEVQQHKTQQKQNFKDTVNAAAGFALVMEAMRDSGKPAVAHNLRFDLAFSLQQFAEPLPKTWEQFKRLVPKWFPGGVFDTKHVARQLPGLMLTDTTLGGLHDSLVQVRFAAASGLLLASI